MANGFMSPVPSPLDFDPMRGYSSQMPVLGQGPMASQAEPAGPLMSVLGAAPVAPPAPRATPLASVLAQYGVTPDLASLELPRPGGGAMQSITMAAPGGPVAPPVAAAATAPAAAPPARAMARPGAAAGGVPDTFMGVDLTGAKQALAGFQREQPKSELGRIAYGVRSAEADAARAALTRAGAEQAGAVQTLEQAQEAQRVAAASEAELASQRAEQARIEEENAAIERERRRQLVEETTQKLDAANKALDESKIDIEAAYGGAAGRIFAGLAVALGSFGASMTGGPNYAMQLVNQRIDREIDAQKTELEKKKGKVSQLGQLLQRNEGLLGDAEQARRLAKAQTFKALADDVEARNKGRALAPQQAQVLQTLRSQQAQAMSDLQLGVERATAARQMVGAEERARMAAAAGAARAQAAKDARELQMFADKEAIKATFANRGPEAAAKLAEQTSQLATKLIDKDFSAAAGNYLDIASQVGIDPMTGKSTGKDPRGLGLVNLGILTPEGRINRQATDALAERMAKSFGGVVTESDREAARKLLKGAGTVEDIQRGIFAYGQAIGRNMRTLQAGNPVAYDTMSERMPLLREAASIGQARDVQRAAGFQAVR